MSISRLDSQPHRRRRRMAALLLLVGLAALVLVAGLCRPPASSAAVAVLPPAPPRLNASPLGITAAMTTHTFLPNVFGASICGDTPETYADVSVNPPVTDRPADVHADLNLSLRGWELATGVPKTLIDLGGATDSNAPHLWGLFSDNRTPVFTNVYQVYNWNWSCNCRGTSITNPPATLLGMRTTAGETVHVPSSGYTIGNRLFVPAGGVAIGAGYEVLVLYAADNRITLKYTRDDNVVSGYTLHIENVCVDPDLQALYDSWNAQGRGRLPALNAGQALGRASGTEIRVAIRDTGQFMDPRSRKDWWPGR